MKIVQYDTIRIVREFPKRDDEGLTAADDVNAIVSQTDEERWTSVLDHVADVAPDSFMTTVRVLDDAGNIVAQGSISSGKNAPAAVDFGPLTQEDNQHDGAPSPVVVHTEATGLMTGATRIQGGEFKLARDPQPAQLGSDGMTAFPAAGL